MADHPLRPATDRRLGRPLPHQLANRPHAPPPVPEGFPRGPRCPRPYAALAPLSRGYSPPEGRSRTCSSPVRHSVRAEARTPFDLHALGTPPAFILSQDQTLHQDRLTPRRPQACCQTHRTSGYCHSKHPRTTVLKRSHAGLEDPRSLTSTIPLVRCSTPPAAPPRHTSSTGRVSTGTAALALLTLLRSPCEGARPFRGADSQITTGGPPLSTSD